VVRMNGNSPMMAAIPDRGETITKDRIQNEQYEMLRREALAIVSETRKLETLTATATAAIYAWLVTTKGMSYYAWFIPAALVFLGGIRCKALALRIDEIANYLVDIEIRLLGNTEKPSGWERWCKDNPNSKITYTAIAFWVVLFALTLVAPSYLQQAVDPNP
jgi:hypothetical protein